MDWEKAIERWAPTGLAVIAGIATAFAYPHTSLREDTIAPVLNATVSVGSIAVGFVATAMAMLYSMSASRLIHELKRSSDKRWLRIINYAIESLAWCFVLVIASWIGLFGHYGTATRLNHCLSVFWMSLAIGSGVSVVRVLSVFVLVLHADAKNSLD